MMIEICQHLVQVSILYYYLQKELRYSFSSEINLNFLLKIFLKFFTILEI